MSDPVTALNGARFDGLVSVSETPVQGMITLRGDLSDQTIAKALSTAAGVEMPAARGVSQKGDKGILWMSPDEAMVLCPYADVAHTLASLNEALGKAHALAADVSDARAFFALEGDAIRDVLAKITPADMRPASLPVGELRRTRLAQVAGAFWFSAEDKAHLICFRSVAHYVFGILSKSADTDGAVHHLSAE